MKTKLVTLNNQSFQIGKVPSEAGSFILLRMIGANIQAGALARDKQPPAPAQPTEGEPDKEPATSEEMVRATVFAAFLSGLPFDEFKFVQQSCMKVVAWLSNPKAVGAPMPVMNDYGVWAFDDIGDDIGLVMQLTMEVLVWNLEGFFAAGGLAILMGAATKPATSQQPSQP
jgi:tail assembly chaperone